MQIYTSFGVNSNPQKIHTHSTSSFLFLEGRVWWLLVKFFGCDDMCHSSSSEDSRTSISNVDWGKTCLRDQFHTARWAPTCYKCASIFSGNFYPQNSGAVRCSCRYTWHSPFLNVFDSLLLDLRLFDADGTSSKPYSPKMVVRLMVIHPMVLRNRHHHLKTTPRLEPGMISIAWAWGRSDL